MGQDRIGVRESFIYDKPAPKNMGQLTGTAKWEGKPSDSNGYSNYRASTPKEVADDATKVGTNSMRKTADDMTAKYAATKKKNRKTSSKR